MENRNGVGAVGKYRDVLMGAGTLTQQDKKIDNRGIWNDFLRTIVSKRTGNNDY